MAGFGQTPYESKLIHEAMSKNPSTDWSCSGCSALLPESDLGHKQAGERFCDICTDISASGIFAILHGYECKSTHFAEQY